MKYLTLDFETYYAKDYSLSRKDTTTQDYIMSPRFEVLMASVKWGDDPAVVLEAHELPAFFESVDWADTAMVAHNSLFDASILWWRYGKRPALLIDTMSMAQCLGVPLLTGSASLDKCIRLLREAGYDVPFKGDEVVNALGKHRADFTPDQWAAYKDYCKTDTEITWYLFKVLNQYAPDDELAYQDIILRCYTEPMLKVHTPTVEYELARCRQYKADQLAGVCAQLGCTQDTLSGVLRSNDRFAGLLRAVGGITDDEMAQGAKGSFLIPTKVSTTTGKVTWAFSKNDVGFKELCESDNTFVQALCQARLAAKSSIDETRCEKFLQYGSHGFLPMGYKIGGAHTNRMSGGSAGCFVGETMIVVLPLGAGATEWEYRMIKDVMPTDLIWDGSEWCAHDGVVCHGVKRVYNWDGLTATKNHECFVGYDRDRTERFEWFRVNRYSLTPAILPTGGVCEVLPESNICYADGVKAMVYDILNVGNRHCYVANGKLVHNSANMQNLPSGRREGQSDLLRRSIIAHEGYVVVNFDASQIEARVLCYVANQTDVLNVFANRGDVYSYAASQVYDIPYAEINDGRKSSDPDVAAKYKPIRNYGKVVQLALGYGQGAAGFQRYALLNAGISMDMDEAKRTVNKWRKANNFVTAFWKLCDQALQVMADGGQMYFGGQDGRMFFADGSRVLLGKRCAGIRMPNGLWLNYPNLRVEMENDRPQFVFDKMGYSGKPLKSKAYGGLICENIVQYLAFAIMKQQALWIAKYYPIKMNTHDEWCIVVPREQAEVAAEYMARCMRTAPDYVAGLPLDTEGGWSQSYGSVDDDWGSRPDNPDRYHRFNPMTGDVS